MLKCVCVQKLKNYVFRREEKLVNLFFVCVNLCVYDTRIKYMIKHIYYFIYFLYIFLYS